MDGPPRKRNRRPRSGNQEAAQFETNSNINLNTITSDVAQRGAIRWLGARYGLRPSIAVVIAAATGLGGSL